MSDDGNLQLFIFLYSYYAGKRFWLPPWIWNFDLCRPTAVEDAIRDMHGREFSNRVISVNKAQPKSGDEDSEHGHGGLFRWQGKGKLRRRPFIGAG